MLQGIELAMALIGLFAIVRGRLTLTERSAVIGPRARLLGIVAMLPGLLTLAAFLYVRSLPKTVELPWMWIAQFGLILGCGVVIYALGLRWAAK